MFVARSAYAFTKQFAAPIPAFSFALIMLALTLPLTAQMNTASINGTISDSSGASVQGANIVIENSATGSRREARTNTTGFYSVPQLQPGTYNVTISHDGFRSVKNSNVQLAVNQVATLSISLELGETQQTINVTGDVPLIETSTAGLGTVIGQKETVDLPLNGRQFVQLLQLAPGTVPISVSQSATPAIGAGSTTPSINGGTNRSNLFYIDGMYATDPFFSTFSISPSIDACRNSRNRPTRISPNSGRSTGGTINVATKTGTNTFHGAAYEFLRNN